MKIRLLLVGKTDEQWLNDACNHYLKRISHYTPFGVDVIPNIKNGGKLKPADLKKQEAERILKRIDKEDFLILLDEKGQHYDSKQFSKWIEMKNVSGARNLVFVVAGAFGADESLKKRADMLISLSQMTFPHQLVRVIFLEQLYRAMTIMRNEKYHNE